MSGGRAALPATRSLASAYRQFRQQIHEGAKFLIVGGIGLIIVLIGSYVLHFEFGLGKFTSVTIATVVATAASFLGNRYWSFRHRQGAGARSETIMFFILNAVGLLIQYACIGLVTDVLGLSGKFWYSMANLIGVGIGTLFRFWSYRKWIWVHPEKHLAKLRRGRHRKGRPAPAASPGPAVSPAPAATLGPAASPAPAATLGPAGPPVPATSVSPVGPAHLRLLGHDSPAA